MTIFVAIIIGIVIGLFIGALGGGGGVLTVPALVYLLGEDAHAAAAASLVIVGVAALVGVPAHARSGNVRWAAGAVFGAVGTLAAVGGTMVSRHLDAAVLLLVFAAVIATAASLMLRDARRSRAALSERPGESTSPVEPVLASEEPAAGGAILVAPRATTEAPAPASSEPTIARTDTVPPVPGRLQQGMWIVVGGLAVGLMTGLFGVGGGFLAVPVLVLVMRWPMPLAVGTSLMVIVINSGAALTTRLATQTLDWHIIVPVTAAAIVGVLAGKLVTDRVSSARLTSAFAVMLMMLAIYTATRSLIDLTA